MKRALVAGLVAVTVGCGSKTSSPTAPGSATASSQIMVIQIVGPAQVPPGSVTRYKAIATRYDQTQQDITSQAAWTSSNPAVLTVDGGGATAIEDGEAGIIVQSGGVTGRLIVAVLEAGTSILIGGVFDSGFPLVGARVEITAGTGAGRATTTDTSGTYKLFGVSGAIEIRASLDGYKPDVRTITVTGYAPRFTFNLVPAIAPTDLAGAWDLTFDASPSCTSFVDVARHRTYIATIDQKVSALTVRLSGAKFAPDPGFGPGYFQDNFRARVVGNSVAIKLDSYNYYGAHYDLGEVLPDSRVLTIVGDGTGQVNASTVSGMLTGTFSVASAELAPGTTNCSGTDHRFAFVRRSVTSRR